MLAAIQYKMMENKQREQT